MIRFADSDDGKEKKPRKIDIESSEGRASEGPWARDYPPGGDKSELAAQARPEAQGDLKVMKESLGDEAASAFSPGGASSDRDARAMAQGLAKVEKEAGEVQEKYLRLAAEFENYKKRIAREQREFAERATGLLIAEILPVLDNLERAEESSRSMADSASISEGIKIIVGQMKGILKKEGVEEIAALGQKFDPTRHEAVMVEEARSGENQLIVEEFQKGYIYKGRVLRPSKVKVVILTPGDGKPPD